MMFEKKKKDNKTKTYIKYDNFGRPYLDIKRFLDSDEGKKLDKRMELVSEMLLSKTKEKPEEGFNV